jgi:hypothetical protein
LQVVEPLSQKYRVLHVISSNPKCVVVFVVLQEWDEHDNNFKTLNSQLLKEVADHEAQAAAGGHLLGAAGVSGSRNWLGDEESDKGDAGESWDLEAQGSMEAMKATAKLSGRTLRELAGAGVATDLSGDGDAGQGLGIVAASASQAAGTAALLRLYRQHQAQQGQQGGSADVVMTAADAGTGWSPGDSPEAGGLGGTSSAAAAASSDAGAAGSAIPGADDEGPIRDGLEADRSSSSGMGSEGDEAMESMVAAAMQHEDSGTDAAEAAMARLGSFDEEERQGQRVDQDQQRKEMEQAGCCGQGSETVREEQQEQGCGMGETAMAVEGAAEAGHCEGDQVDGATSEGQSTIGQHQDVDPVLSAEVAGSVEVACAAVPAVLASAMDAGDQTIQSEIGAAPAEVAPEVNDFWDAGIGLSGDPALEKLHGVQQALQQLQHACNSDGGAYMASLQVLKGILSKLVQHPNVPKYKRLRLGNALVQERVGRFPSALEVLRIAGFEQRQEEWQPGLGGMKEDVMVYVRKDVGLLWLVLSALDC